jgi:FkbM family methyltransferase
MPSNVRAMAVDRAVAADSPTKAHTAQQMVYDVLRSTRREWRCIRGQDVHVPLKRMDGATRLGTAYGGWTILPQLLDARSVVYAAGVGDDISWDLAVIDRLGCDVHGFDPTPRCRDWIAQQVLPPQFRFHPYGLAATDGVNTFVMRNEHPDWSSYNMSADTDDAFEVVELDVRRVATIMSELGHDHIDLLKIDIEGAEYEVLHDLVESSINVRQLCVEFHFGGEEGHDVDQFRSALELLRSAGFEAFSRSPFGRELSFVRQGG